MPCPSMTSVLIIDVTRRYCYLDDRASETNHKLVRLGKVPSTLNNTLQQSLTIHLSTLDPFITQLDCVGIGVRARASEDVSNVSPPGTTRYGSFHTYRHPLAVA